MISVLVLERCLQKVNPRFSIYVNPNSKYDVLPARVYHGKTELISVPKGMVERKSRKGDDGSMSHRGWMDIVKILYEYKLVPDRQRLENLLERAESGMRI